jgi:hypothetical protein
LSNKSVFHPKRTAVSLYDKWRHGIKVKEEKSEEKPRRRSGQED